MHNTAGLVVLSQISMHWIPFSSSLKFSVPKLQLPKLQLPKLLSPNLSLLLLLFLTFGIAGCSAKQINVSSDFQLAETPSEPLTLVKDVIVSTSSAKELVLKAESRWTHIGDIEQGRVLRTKDQLVQVNSYNVYEADIVINNNQVVGYYIPTEKTFVATRKADIELSE